MQSLDWKTASVGAPNARLAGRRTLDEPVAASETAKTRKKLTVVLPPDEMTV